MIGVEWGIVLFLVGLFTGLAAGKYYKWRAIMRINKMKGDK